MSKNIVPEERSSQNTFNMVHLIEALKHYADKEPISLKDLSKRCDFCSVHTLRNLLEALHRKTTSNNNILPFTLFKYIRNNKTKEFFRVPDTYSAAGETYFYKIYFHIKKSEIKLLTDAISMFPFLNSEQTIKLVKTIEKITSNPDLTNLRQTMDEYNYKAHSSKVPKKTHSSEKFFDVVEIITDSIKQKKCIAFEYNTYAANPEKDRLVFARRSEKIFHPAFFMWSNGFYYLVGKDDKMIDGNLMNLRVDRIENVRIMENLNIVEMPVINPAKYRDENPVMFGGKKVLVEFVAAENILNAVVDSFGKNIVVRPSDYTDSDNNEFVIVRAYSTVEGAAMWITEYCKYSYARSPQSLVNKVVNNLRIGLSHYENRYQ